MPVIGIVQVGNQALADRYAYVPLIGLLIAIVWSGADLLEAGLAESKRRRVAWLATAGVCGLLAVATHAQLRPWQSSRTLFLHAIAVTDPNPVMQRELGVVLSRAGDPAAALPHFEEAAARAPGWSLALHDLGGVLTELGHPEQALPHLERSVALDPEHANTRAALGATLLALGRADEARAQLEHAVRLEPSAEYLALLADAEARSGQLDAAIASQQRAVVEAEAAGSPDAARLRARLEALAQQRAKRGAPASSTAPAEADAAARPQLVAPTRGARPRVRREP